MLPGCAAPFFPTLVTTRSSLSGRASTILVHPACLPTTCHCEPPSHPSPALANCNLSHQPPRPKTATHRFPHCYTIHQPAPAAQVAMASTPPPSPHASPHPGGRLPCPPSLHKGTISPAHHPCPPPPAPLSTARCPARPLRLLLPLLLLSLAELALGPLQQGVHHHIVVHVITARHGVATSCL